jgi:hypothetical protein
MMRGGAALMALPKAEGRCIEVVISRRTWVLVQVQWTAAVIRLVDAAVVDSVRVRANKRIVSVVDHGDGEAARKMGNARERLSLRQAIGVKDLIDRKLILIADDEVMLHIERVCRFARTAWCPFHKGRGYPSAS